jgi:hypothetical protein
VRFRAHVELHSCFGRVLLSSNDDVVEVGGRLPRPPSCSLKLLIDGGVEVSSARFNKCSFTPLESGCFSSILTWCSKTSMWTLFVVVGTGLRLGKSNRKTVTCKGVSKFTYGRYI